ncbi:MAG: C39 family peptidase [Clostridia bacterium]|nr:C39 family peptidase [Clostridia bacterium]
MSILLLIAYITIALPACLAQAEGAVVAESKSTARYTKRSTKIYKKKSIDSKVLGRIPKGVKVSVLSTSGSWCKVSYGGNTGFIKKASLKKVSSDPDETGDTDDDADDTDENDEEGDTPDDETITQVVQNVRIVNGSNKSDPGMNGETVEDKDDSGLTKLDRNKNKISSWAKYIVMGEGGMAIPQLYQGDFTQTVCVYNGTARSVATSGCGATSLSMVIAYLTGNTQQSPYTLFREACQDGMYNGNGLSHNTLTKLAERYNVKGDWQSLSAAELQQLLKDGVPVIAHMGSGYFTQKGHYIVLRGVTDDGMILVNDPASPENSAKAYPVEIFMEEKRLSKSFMVMTKGSSNNAGRNSSTIYIIPTVNAGGEADVPGEETIIEGVVTEGNAT